MNNNPFNQTEFLLKWKLKGNQCLQVKKFIANNDCTTHVIFENRNDGSKLIGKISTESSESEVYHWKSLDHRSLTPFLGIAPIDPKLSIYFSTYWEKSLRAMVHDEEFLNLSSCFIYKKIYVEDVLWGLTYLHRRSLCLCNMNDANVFICKRTNKAVITDFSCLASIHKATRHSFVLPLFYRAPELHTEGKSRKHESFNPIAADMWAVGVMIMEIFVQHRVPWALIDYDQRRTTEVIDTIDYDLLRNTNMGSPISTRDLAEFKAFVRTFLIKKPHRRCSARSAVSSVFLQLPKHRVRLGSTQSSPLLQRPDRTRMKVADNPTENIEFIWDKSTHAFDNFSRIRNAIKTCCDTQDCLASEKSLKSDCNKNLRKDTHNGHDSNQNIAKEISNKKCDWNGLFSHEIKPLKCPNLNLQSCPSIDKCDYSSGKDCAEPMKEYCDSVSQKDIGLGFDSEKDPSPPIIIHKLKLQRKSPRHNKIGIPSFGGNFVNHFDHRNTIPKTLELGKVESAKSNVNHQNHASNHPNKSMSFTIVKSVKNEFPIPVQTHYNAGSSEANIEGKTLEYDIPNNAPPSIRNSLKPDRSNTSDVPFVHRRKVSSKHINLQKSGKDDLSLTFQKSQKHVSNHKKYRNGTPGVLGTSSTSKVDDVKQNQVDSNATLKNEMAKVTLNTRKSENLSLGYNPQYVRHDESKFSDEHQREDFKECDYHTFPRRNDGKVWINSSTLQHINEAFDDSDIPSSSLSRKYRPGSTNIHQTSKMHSKKKEAPKRNENSSLKTFKRNVCLRRKNSYMKAICGNDRGSAVEFVSSNTKLVSSPVKEQNAPKSLRKHKKVPSVPSPDPSEFQDIDRNASKQKKKKRNIFSLCIGKRR